jgi:hypothetical protein
MPVATERTTKKDIIKIGTSDVVIQEDNKGPMIFGESVNTTKKEDTTTIKTADPKILHASMVPSRIDTVPKAKITAPKSKGEPREGGRKDIQ